MFHQCLRQYQRFFQLRAVGSEADGYSTDSNAMSPVKRQDAASDACGGSIYFLNAARPGKVEIRFTGKASYGILKGHCVSFQRFLQEEPFMLKRIKDSILDILRQADWLLLCLCCGAARFGIVRIASAKNFLG